MKAPAPFFLLLVALFALFACQMPLLGQEPASHAPASSYSDSTFRADSIRLQQMYLQAWSCYNRTRYDSFEIIGRQMIDLGSAMLQFRQDSAVYVLTYWGQASAGQGRFLNGYFEEGIQEAMEAVNKIIERYGEYTPVLMYSFNGAAFLYQDDLGDYDKALYYLRKSMDVKKKILPENHTLIGNQYNLFANLFWGTGEYDRAIDYEYKALAIWEPVDPLTKFFYLRRIAELHLQNQNTPKALEASLELLKAFESPDMLQYMRLHPDKKRQYDSAKINGFLIRAKIFLASGDIAQAKACYRQFKELISKNSIGKTTEINFLAEAYSSLGNLDDNPGLSAEALQFFLEAITTWEELYKGSNILANSLYNQAVRLFIKQQRFEEALDYNNRVLSLVSPGIINSDHLDTAYLQKVFPTNYLIESLVDRASIYSGKALFTNNDKDHQDAEAFFATFDPVAERMFMTYDDDFSRIKFSGKITNYYQTAIDYYSRIYEKRKDQKLLNIAFQYSERLKNFALLISIRTARARIFSNTPPGLLSLEKDLKLKIALHERKMFEEEQKNPGKTTENFTRWNKQVIELRQKQDSLKNILADQYPKYYHLNYNLNVSSIEDAQKVLAKNTTLVQYQLADSNIHVFVVRPEGYEVVTIKKDFPLELWVDELRNGIYGYYSSEVKTEGLQQKTLRQYLESAQKLYAKLLHPVEGQLTKSLVIIPDGVLGYIPFDALLKAPPKDPLNFGNYPFLCREYTISYCYSVTLLQEMQQKQHIRPPERTLLAMAPFYQGTYQYLEDQFGNVSKVLDAEEARETGGIVMRRNFGSLPYSGEEVVTAGKLWRGDYLINSDATRERFMHTAENYRILHLSTHGVADNRLGEYAYLAFAEVPDSLENELLYVRDLYGLTLNADLVALSACETGVGKLHQGEGIISLARAFAYAGAKSLVTTLWVSDDFSTKELMKEFYLYLRKGASKDEALNLAKLHYLKKFGGEAAHPFYWAGFMPVGDMNPLK